MADNDSRDEQTAAHPSREWDDGPPQAWSALVNLDKPRRPDPVEPLVADPEPVVQDPSDPVVVPAEPEYPEPEHDPSRKYDDVPPPPAHPVVVAGTYLNLRRWVLALALLGAWIPAAAVGLGLYRWWYVSADSTAPVLVLALWVVACTVGALLMAMAETKPWLSGAAIAVMTAPFASMAAAGALHGMYVFGWVSP